MIHNEITHFVLQHPRKEPEADHHEQALRKAVTDMYVLFFISATLASSGAWSLPQVRRARGSKKKRHKNSFCKGQCQHGVETVHSHICQTSRAQATLISSGGLLTPLTVGQRVYAETEWNFRRHEVARERGVRG